MARPSDQRTVQFLERPAPTAPPTAPIPRPPSRVVSESAPTDYATVGFYAGIGVLGVGSLYAGYRHLKRRGRDLVITDVIEPPPPKPKEKKMLVKRYPFLFQTASRVKRLQELVYALPEENYRSIGWDRAQIFLDFSRPFEVSSPPYKYSHGIIWNSDVDPVQVAIDPTSAETPATSVERAAEEMWNKLKSFGVVKSQRGQTKKIAIGFGHESWYLLVYAPIKETNYGKRKNALKVQELQYVIGLSGFKNISSGQPLARTPSEIQITNSDKEFIARILTAELNSWNPSGNCYLNKPAAPIYCELERAGIAQAAYNRIQEKKRRTGRQNLTREDYINIRKSWNNSAAFVDFFNNRNFSSDLEFVELAMHLPLVVGDRDHFIHPYGLSTNLNTCFQVWFVHKDDDGIAPEYPVQIGYGLFSKPDNSRVDAIARIYCDGMIQEQRDARERARRERGET